MEDDKSCTVSSKFHFSDMTGMLNKLRQDKLYTDATILCCSIHYPVHRLILAMSSKYFQDLLKQTENIHPFAHPVIALQGIKKKEIEAILSFIYRGEVSVEENHLPGLLDVAQKLGVKGLCDANLRALCSTRKGMKRVSLVKKKPHSVIDTVVDGSTLSVTSEIVSERQLSEHKRKQSESDDGNVMNIQIDSVSSCAANNFEISARPVRQVTKRRKMGFEEDCSSEEFDSGDEMATSEEQVEKDDNRLAEKATEAVNENLFVHVNMEDPPEPVPGTSGYCQTSDADNLHEGEGINFDDEGSSTGIKEEVLDVEDDYTVNETIFLPIKDEFGDDEHKSDESPEKHKDVLSEFSSNYPEPQYENLPTLSASATNKKEYIPEKHEDVSEFISNYPEPQYESLPTLSASATNKKEYIPEEDLPTFMKQCRVYKYSQTLGVLLKEEFWEQEGICSLLIGIKNGLITLKEAATLVGTTYSIFYRQYAAVYGGVKQVKYKDRRDVSNPKAKTYQNLQDVNNPNTQTFECRHCPYTSPDKHLFLVHLETHTQASTSTSSIRKEFISCGFCRANFLHECNLRQHMETQHKNHTQPSTSTSSVRKEFISCGFCRAKFLHECDLCQHMATQHKPSTESKKLISCGFCNAKFAHMRTLRQHMAIQHKTFFK